MVLFAAVAGIGSVFAQSIIEKNKKISKDEVPAAVKQTFLKDHSDLEDKGYWQVFYTEKTENGKTVFTPEYYTFTGKKTEKSRVDDSTAGALELPKDEQGPLMTIHC